MPGAPAAPQALPRALQEPGAAPGSGPAAADVDFSCAGIPKWVAVREIFGAAAPVLATEPLGAGGVRQLLDVALGSMVEGGDKGAMTQQDDCGLGRLLLHILATIADDYTADELGHMVRQIEPLHSPLMTVLLDIPWAQVTQSMWPFAAVLHQLSLRRREALPPEFDQLKGVHQQFHAFITAALAEGKAAEAPAVLGEAAQQYIDATRDAPPSATGTAAAVLARGLAQRDAAALDAAQSLVQQLVASPTDLDAFLVSHWPVFQLWSLYR